MEKVDQLAWRVSRKKASVEAMLKTAMQSQLDGVRTGLNQLERALQDIADIKQCCGDMEGALGGVAACWESCREVSHIPLCGALKFYLTEAAAVAWSERIEQAKSSVLVSKITSLLHCR